MKRSLQVRQEHRPSGREGENAEITICLHHPWYSWLLNKQMSLLLLLLFLATAAGFAQKHVENLGRGLVAVRTNSSQVFVSWRLLGTDSQDIAFNLYRGGTKLNPAPLTGATNFTDETSANETYTVRAIVEGQEQAASAPASVWTDPFKRLPLQKPAGGTTPDGVSYTYSPGDCSVGDLDGDGEYDIVVKWDPSNAKDNSQAGYTGNVYLDAYKMDGTRLWRIDLGKNIRAGAHYTQYIVYDLDSDGRAELACKTADGTVDGVGTVIGNPTTDYRNQRGYVLNGPEYLTIFNGQTGGAMATTDYAPARGNVASWGDDYGNRVDRFLAGVGYFDGQRPSLLITRGYYTRAVLVAWDWRNGQLTQRWKFDTNDEGNSAYAGQGYHNLSINDVDGDGKDEVSFGSMTIDDNGKGLYSTRLGHGDAQHVGDLDPDRPGLESWTSHESQAEYQGNGLWMRDATTGEKLWGVPTTGDIGRAMTADIDPRYKGNEAWGARGGLYTAKGVQISTARPGSMNFGSWWDGDLQRELLDGTVIDKWNYTTSAQERLLTAQNFGAASNNGTKSNPGLSADILGDWREEIIYRSSNNDELLIFTTTIPTAHKLYTFMHDTQYRAAIAWQNVGYNQPPHTSFYVGEGMATPPKPAITLVANAAPTPAVYLTARGDDAKVRLGWSTNNVTLARLEIYRDTDSNPSGRVRITSLSGTVTSYIDEGLTNGTTYYYWIKGYDASNQVVNSSVANATPNGVSLPPLPAIVELNASAGDKKVDLNWSIQNVDIRQVEIYRDTDANPSGRTRIGIVAANATSYSDNTVTNGIPYWYWLKVIATDGKTPGSNAAQATPEAARIITLAAKPSDRLVDLSWTTENFQSITGIEVFRGTTADVTTAAKLTALETNALAYTDLTVTNGTTYWYWVKITDAKGVTTSNEAEATPTPLEGIYTFTAVHSGMVLDLQKTCTGNNGNGNVVQRAAGSTGQQQWQITSVGEGSYVITNLVCGQALGVKAQSTFAEGANILQWEYAGTAKQQWDLVRMANGYYSIINKHSGQSVTVEEASMADGANVKQFTFTNGENQLFRLDQISQDKAVVAEAKHGTLAEMKRASAVVYPNPTTEAFSISTEGVFEYTVLDQLGRVVETGKAENELRTGSKLKAGLYIINIKTHDQTQQLKVIKN